MDEEEAVDLDVVVVVDGGGDELWKGAGETSCELKFNQATKEHAVTKKKFKCGLGFK